MSGLIDQLSKTAGLTIQLTSTQIEALRAAEETFQSWLQAKLVQIPEDQKTGDPEKYEYLYLIDLLEDFIEKHPSLHGGSTRATREAAFKSLREKVNTNNEFILQAKPFFEKLAYLIMEDEAKTGITDDVKAIELSGELTGLFHSLQACGEGAQAQFQSKVIVLDNGSLAKRLGGFVGSLASSCAIPQWPLFLRKIEPNKYARVEDKDIPAMNVHFKSYYWQQIAALGLKVGVTFVEDPFATSDYYEIEYVPGTLKHKTGAALHVQGYLDVHFNVDEFISSVESEIRVFKAKMKFKAFDDDELKLQKLLAGLAFIGITKIDLDNLITSSLQVPYSVMNKIVKMIESSVKTGEEPIVFSDKKPTKFAKNLVYIWQDGKDLIFYCENDDVKVERKILYSEDPDSLYQKIAAAADSGQLDYLLAQILRESYDMNSEFIRLKIIEQAQKDALLQSVASVDKVSARLDKARVDGSYAERAYSPVVVKLSDPKYEILFYNFKGKIEIFAKFEGKFIPFKSMIEKFNEEIARQLKEIYASNSELCASIMLHPAILSILHTNDLLKELFNKLIRDFKPDYNVLKKMYISEHESEHFTEINAFMFTRLKQDIQLGQAGAEQFLVTLLTENAGIDFFAWLNQDADNLAWLQKLWKEYSESPSRPHRELLVAICNCATAKLAEARGETRKDEAIRWVNTVIRPSLAIKNDVAVLISDKVDSSNKSREYNIFHLKNLLRSAKDSANDKLFDAIIGWLADNMQFTSYLIQKHQNAPELSILWEKLNARKLSANKKLPNSAVFRILVNPTSKKVIAANPEGLLGKILWDDEYLGTLTVHQLFDLLIRKPTSDEKKYNNRIIALIVKQIMDAAKFSTSLAEEYIGRLLEEHKDLLKSWLSYAVKKGHSLLRLLNTLDVDNFKMLVTSAVFRDFLIKDASEIRTRDYFGNLYLNKHLDLLISDQEAQDLPEVMQYNSYLLLLAFKSGSALEACAWLENNPENLKKLEGLGFYAELVKQLLIGSKKISDEALEKLMKYPGFRKALSSAAFKHEIYNIDRDTTLKYSPFFDDVGKWLLKGDLQSGIRYDALNDRGFMEGLLCSQYYMPLDKWPLIENAQVLQVFLSGFIRPEQISAVMEKMFSYGLKLNARNLAKIPVVPKSSDESEAYTLFYNAVLNRVCSILEATGYAASSESGNNNNFTIWSQMSKFLPLVLIADSAVQTRMSLLLKALYKENKKDFLKLLALPEMQEIVRAAQDTPIKRFVMQLVNKLPFNILKGCVGSYPACAAHNMQIIQSFALRLPRNVDFSQCLFGDVELTSAVAEDRKQFNTSFIRHVLENALLSKRSLIALCKWLLNNPIFLEHVKSQHEIYDMLRVKLIAAQQRYEGKVARAQTSTLYWAFTSDKEPRLRELEDLLQQFPERAMDESAGVEEEEKEPPLVMSLLAGRTFEIAKKEMRARMQQATQPSEPTTSEVPSPQTPVLARPPQPRPAEQPAVTLPPPPPPPRPTEPRPAYLTSAPVPPPPPPKAASTPPVGSVAARIAALQQQPPKPGAATAPPIAAPPKPMIIPRPRASEEHREMPRAAPQPLPHIPAAAAPHAPAPVTPGVTAPPPPPIDEAAKRRRDFEERRRAFEKRSEAAPPAAPVAPGPRSKPGQGPGKAVT